MESFRAKKSYGQHFLIQQKIVDRIAQLILKESNERILEIGPGKGALTMQLYNKGKDFIAVEADREMADYLKAHFPELNEHLILNDILKVDIANLFQGKELCVCGNFPYNISSQIVFKVLENTALIPVMIGMFQKEMAERFIALPRTKEYGILSVLCQLNYDVKICFDIGPGNFTPPPKVTSSVVLFTRKVNYVPFTSFREIKNLVKTSFQFRRKTLRNNLKSFVQDKSLLEDVYFNRRPEELTFEDYVILLNTIQKSHAKKNS